MYLTMCCINLLQHIIPKLFIYVYISDYTCLFKSLQSHNGRHVRVLSSNTV